MPRSVRPPGRRRFWGGSYTFNAAADPPPWRGPRRCFVMTQHCRRALTPAMRYKRLNGLCQCLLVHLIPSSDEGKKKKMTFPACNLWSRGRGRAGERGDGKEQGLSSMFYLHLHCSAAIAQRITAADVKGKNGFSQDGFDPLICPWGTAQMLGLGLHSLSPSSSSPTHPHPS